MPELIYFDMARAPDGGWAELTLQQWVWWPALCYRVVAPETTDQELNLFERSILGLSRVRVTDLDEQSRLLGLDQRLIQTIRTQLQEEDLLDSDYRITAKGIETLRGGVLDSGRLVTGYVFQDPFSGSMWDRFIEAESERYAQIERVGDALELVRGNPGKERRHRPVAVEHGTRNVPVPTPADLASAIRRHRREIERRRPGAGWNRDASDEPEDHRGSEPEGPVRVGRVELRDQAPIRCFLSTYLYSRSAIPLPSSLLAADPFGMGASDRMLRQVLDLADEHRDSPLRRRLDAAFRKKHQTTWGDYRQQQQAFRISAERQVEAALGMDLRLHAVFLPLVRMEESLLEAQALGDSQGNERQMVGLAHGRAVLEALLRSGLEAGSLAGLERHLDLPLACRTKEGVHARLEHLGSLVGLASPLPEHVSTAAMFQQVRGLTRDRGRIDRAGTRDLFVLNLLLAVRDRSHPLRRAAAREPRVADRLFALADRCNPAAHGRLPLGTDPVEFRNELYALTEVLLDLRTVRPEVR